MKKPVSGAKRPQPCAIVIFGAGGDLAKRLLLPALYNLQLQGLLPDQYAIIGVAQSPRTTKSWIKEFDDFFKTMIKSPDSEFQAKSIDAKALKAMQSRMSYFQGDTGQPETYTALAEHIAGIDKQMKLGGNVLFYLALPEKFFGPTVQHLGNAGLLQQAAPAWRRVVIEKPFGHSVNSAKTLNDDILKCLDESQIYRIDHFLGKETVQNIMALRFGNTMFEPVWNRDYIDHVQITVSETVGVEQRGKFYEPTGALRDMVPNHLFQLVAMTAMEPPASFEAEEVRSKKAEALAAIRPVPPENAVRGQYAEGKIGRKKIKAYRESPDVSPKSTTETYAALKLDINNWRWAGVPFYLRTGKCMTRRSTEIALRFKEPALTLFPRTAADLRAENWLVLEIQPSEGIKINFNAKLPGTAMVLAGVELNFNYADFFKQGPAVGYETLIYDVLLGDPTLFQRADQVEAAWRAVQPVLDAWGQKARGIPNYGAGSTGPADAEKLLRRDQRQWRPLVGDL